MRQSILSLIVAGTWLVSGAWAGGIDETPAAFAPFEHMIGAWKGTASPVVNRVKGWPETHAWAWKFANGKPVAMTVEWKGDKTVSKGLLIYDLATKTYKLDGVDPEGKTAVYLGPISSDGKTLTLDKVGVPRTAPNERLIIRPNANRIRYTLQVETQEPGAPQFKKEIEVGLTKVGESFAAGSGGENLPKCIMTGGAATITVSYQGKTYPVCCTGCRDEFNENPAKYAKQADEIAKTQPKGKTKADGSKGKDDGSFDGLFEDLKPKS